MTNTKNNSEIIDRFLNKNYKLVNDKILTRNDDNVSPNSIIIELSKIFSHTHESSIENVIYWLKNKGLSIDKIKKLISKFSVEIVSEKFNVIIPTDNILLSNERQEMIKIGNMSMVGRTSYSDSQISINRKDLDKDVVNFLFGYLENYSLLKFDINISQYDEDFLIKNSIKYLGCFFKEINARFSNEGFATFEDDRENYLIDLTISVDMVKV